jgi:hypothetical protein
MKKGGASASIQVTESAAGLVAGSRVVMIKKEKKQFFLLCHYL